MNHIRNFCIIAHIDHGKSTLADRLLEVTGTVPARKMRPQYLDRLELERERGITIKMAPVRMVYSINHAQAPNSKSQILNKPQIQNSNNLEPRASNLELVKSEYILNLIDTPGHSDFSYEVSRALAAVEGAILLVDATKGIQAQTLSNFRQAQKAGLKIIGAVNKIDMNPPQLEKIVESLSMLLKVPASEIFRVSGKTGAGVDELLKAVVEKIPPPTDSKENQALIFDSLYDDHRGILAFIRNFGGSFHTGEEVYLLTNKTKVKFKEIGYFSPELTPSKEIRSGEMGYLATGIKESDLIRIGDTVSSDPKAHPLPGYREPRPVVFISFYPTASSKFEDMKNALGKLKLTDSALLIEPEANDALGRGLKIGFLGQLHFEIISSRLSQEFGIEFISSFPSVAYRVEEGTKEYIIKQPQDFPVKPDKVFQPMIKVEILSPAEYLSQVINLKKVFDLEVAEVQNLGENIIVLGKMPLSELIRDFDDQLKSVSQGFASFSYELISDEEAEMEKLEIIVAGDTVPALTRIVAKKDLEKEARKSAEKLKELLPKQQFTQAIQATSGGRIIARETIPAMKKLLGNFGKTGGDRTRKMKLWKKQQRGKARLKETGRVEVPVSVFREILKK